VTKQGTLWTRVKGENCALGHNDINVKRLLTQMEAQHFEDVRIVSAAGGE